MEISQEYYSTLGGCSGSGGGVLEEWIGDHYSERAEARSASRSKMRGARPRRARDRWVGTLKRVGACQACESHHRILGVEGGRIEKKGFFEPPEI